MQIGKGNDGVKIGEYGSGEQVDPDDGNSVIGYFEPACEKPQWIFWFTKRGDGILYTQREATGGVIGEPIHVKARIDSKRHRSVGYSSISKSSEPKTIAVIVSEPNQFDDYIRGMGFQFDKFVNGGCAEIGNLRLICVRNNSQLVQGITLDAVVPLASIGEDLKKQIEVLMRYHG
jgi:hypothetical protein